MQGRALAMSEWRPPSGYSQVKGESTVSEAEVEDGGNSIVLRVPRGIKLSSLARIERESGLVYDKEGRAFRMVPLGPEQLMDMEVYVSHGGKGYKPAGEAKITQVHSDGSRSSAARVCGSGGRGN